MKGELTTKEKAALCDFYKGRLEQEEAENKWQHKVIVKQAKRIADLEKLLGIHNPKLATIADLFDEYEQTSRKKSRPPRGQ